MKKILFNWYYHRQDLTSYLLSFAKDAELVFLYRQFPEEVPAYLKGISNISFIYWSDFGSPGQLLKKVNPAILLRGIDIFPLMYCSMGSADPLK